MGLFGQFRAFWYFLSRKDKVLRDFAVGLSSEVDIKRDLHILFLDFDGVSLVDVEDSVVELQSFWRLSDAFIYKTRNGFHVYFFYDIMPYSRVVMILNFARFVDDKFRYISRFYDYKTIRVVGKYKERDIVFVKLVKGSRRPSLLEAELGDLKRLERDSLSRGEIFRKELLKE